MKLAIINCVNGNFAVIAEGITSDQAARVQFHDRCRILWNAPDVITGEVAVLDEQLDVYQGLKELIRHTPVQPAPEPEPEPEPDPEPENGGEPEETEPTEDPAEGE